jgi:hypothetical protein
MDDYEKEQRRILEIDEARFKIVRGFQASEFRDVENVDGKKKFRWPDHQYSDGSTFMYPGCSVTLDRDGNLIFEAAVQNNSSRETWNLRWDFFDSSGNHVFTNPKQDFGEAFYFHTIAVVGRAEIFGGRGSYRKELFDQIGKAKFDFRQE